MASPDYVYTKNRDRLLADDNFSMDGTLLQTWASHASLKQNDGQENHPPTGPGERFGAPKEGKKRAKGDFRGIKLSNETHRSSTEPVDAVSSEGVALLARKSKAHPAQLSDRGHVL